MHGTVQDLEAMASFITRYGLHTGTQFAAPGPAAPMDICAVAYIVAERCAPPAEFYSDEDASIRLIEASAHAMEAIKAISQALDSEPCEDEIAPGLYVANHLEHVSNWAATASPVEPKRLPTVDEVIGRILRAANTLAIQTAGIRPGFTDAYGLCLTCRGHGSLTVDGEEIPYEELSPRRKQGHDLGHRFYRNTSKPCPDCDGRDRVTDAAVSAYEASL